MDMIKFGKTICYLRKKAGFTQKQLAVQIGISDKAVSKWERGLALPDMSYLAKLSIILDADTEALLTGDVLRHNSGWCGFLMLPHNDYNIGYDSVVYDKPMVYYLLCNFLLVGIRRIIIVCDENEKSFLDHELGDGNSLGIEILYCDCSFKKVCECLKEHTQCARIMAIYNRFIMCGTDQTRIFQRAMSETNSVTLLSVPRHIGENYGENHLLKSEMAVAFNNDRKVVFPNDPDRLRTQYEYYPTPLVFAENKLFCEMIYQDQDGNAAFNPPILPRDGIDIYTINCSRGYGIIKMNTPEELLCAGAYVRILQKSSGMQLCCLEEVAWRRGMIDYIQLREAGLKKFNTNYGKYLISLHNI